MNERNPRDHVTYLLARTRVVEKLAYSSYVTSAHEVGQWTHVREEVRACEKDSDSEIIVYFKRTYLENEK